MSHQPSRCVIWLGLIWLLVCWPLRAQSPFNPARCSSSSPTNDENAESAEPGIFWSQAETLDKAVAKVVVDEVAFDGPNSLPNSVRDQLVADTKQKEHWGSNWTEELNEVGVRGAWMDQGFFKMTSTVKSQTISSDATEQHVSVTILVDEGIQYRLKDIRFQQPPDDWSVQNHHIISSAEETAEIHKPSLRKKVLPYAEAERFGSAELAFPSEELRKRVPLTDGALFTTGQIREGLDVLKRLYFSHGYINFVATPLTEVDDRTGMISLILELDEGRQFRVRERGVQGLDPQTEGGLKWRIQPGDIFNNELFEDFLADNKDILPTGASPQNAYMSKNEKNGTVDVWFRFPNCP